MLIKRKYIKFDFFLSFYVKKKSKNQVVVHPQMMAFKIPIIMLIDLPHNEIFLLVNLYTFFETELVK